MRKFQKGISLIETIVAMGIAILVIYFATTLLKSTNKQVSNSSEKFYKSTLLAIVSGSLQKYMASGDLRFLGFVGTASPAKAVVRALIPVPGKCGDLTTNCTDDVSFVYSHYDKLTTPTVTVICNYQDPSGTNGNNWVWLVDLNNDTYGPATFNAGKNAFEVTPAPNASYIAGPITVKNNEVIALMNPPFATLWVAQGNATLLNGVSDTTPTAGTVPLPATCANNLQRNGVKYKVDKLYTVSYRPMIFSQFSGGSLNNITNSMVASAQGGYPLRIFTSQFRSVGRRQLPNGEWELAINQCSVNGTTIGCNGTVVASVPKTIKTRIEAVYQIKFKDSDAESFEFYGETVPPLTDLWKSCGSPKCEGLLVKNTIPVLATATESFENLTKTQFSFLKQEAIQKLRYKLVTGNGKEESFDVIFP